MRMMEFVYKGKNYSWEEWNKEYLLFVDELELPNDLMIDLNMREFSLTHDIGYGIAIDKFRELYSLIASARLSLINAFQKFYDSNIINWNSGGYRAQLWMRYNHLKNSIIWYNSCEDYTYQILWFAYEMNPYHINSKQSYLRNLKKCNFDRIDNLLSEIEESNSYAKDLRKNIRDYRYDPDVEELREELANNLKHRANIQASGLEDLRMMGYVIKSRDGSEAFNSQWLQPKLIDLDVTIELLKRVHLKLIKHCRYIMDFMSFDELFEVDSEGNAILNNIRSKSDYKKFNFSDKAKQMPTS
jgi:hypothetical protein